ncbi:hypothetical protein GYB29_11610 [bacterium]|jgi:hypothetical protein|nr:hypothetical protein [Balneola sp.]MBR9918298.1 hypothetical protein [bacterium]
MLQRLVRLLPLVSFLFIFSSCFPETDECLAFDNNVEISFIELLDDEENNLIQNQTYNAQQINLLLDGRSVGSVFTEDPVYKYLVALFEEGIDTVDSPRYELVLNDSQRVFIDMRFSTVITDCDTKLHAIESARVKGEDQFLDVINGYQVVGVTVNESTITKTK